MTEGAVGKLRAGRALAVAAVGVVLLLVALTFDAAPLIVPGLGLISLGVLTPAWVSLAARGARVERRLGATRIMENEPLETILRLNRGLVGLPGAVLHDPLLTGPLTVESRGLRRSGRQPIELRVVARIRRRGLHTFGTPVLVLSDPLDLTLATRPGGGSDELLVLPRTERVNWFGHGRQRFVLGVEANPHSEPVRAGEVDGLRDYLPGTPAARIHWPALARGVGLLERRMSAELRSLPLVVLDARLPAGDPQGEDHLDAAVGAAASLVLELARTGGCSVLLPTMRLPVPVSSDLAAWPSVHTRLALVASEDPLAPPPGIRSGTGSGTVFYVAARVDPASPAPTLNVRAPRIVLVVPDKVAGGLELQPSFRVRGCTGFALAAAPGRSGLVRPRSATA